jgi:hypothetical protein
MIDEKAVAFVNSQVACAMIKAMGYTAENAQRNAQQDSPAYVADDFERLINDHGIGHNDVIATLNGAI